MEKHQKTIMVIAPHADDEVLGCGGYLLHQVKEGARVVVVLGTIGGSNARQGDKTLICVWPKHRR